MPQMHNAGSCTLLKLTTQILECPITIILGIGWRVRASVEVSRVQTPSSSLYIAGRQSRVCLSLCHLTPCTSDGFSRWDCGMGQYLNSRSRYYLTPHHYLRFVAHSRKIAYRISTPLAMAQFLNGLNTFLRPGVNEPIPPISVVELGASPNFCVKG